MIHVAIIGYGYWGPKLVRNFLNTPLCKLVYVVDTNQKRLVKVQQKYPGLKTTLDFNTVINNPEIDAIVIATPVALHFPLAKKALEAGKHVLLEKPMTRSVIEAKILIDIALAKGKLLMVDHTYLYNNAVQAIKALIDNDVIGKLMYLDSTRINLGLFQTDVNVLWDLAPHDISICSYLMEESPLAVQAIGVSHIHNQLENMAYLHLYYPENKIAHFNCSWVSPVKIRQMLIGGDKKMILFNDLETTEKVRIYDKGYTVLPESDRDQVLVDYRIGDIQIPKIPQTEALANMATDFITCIQENKTPVSNFKNGLEVVRILEAADHSMKNKGKKVFLGGHLAPLEDTAGKPRTDNEKPRPPVDGEQGSSRNLLK